MSCKPEEPQRDNVQQARDGHRGRKLAVPGIMVVGSEAGWGSRPDYCPSEG